MDDQNPLDRLIGIAERLRLVLGDEEDAAWLLGAVQRHIAEDMSIDELLGIKGPPGSRSPRYRIMKRERDQLLREALWHCAGDCKRLHAEIQSYFNRVPARQRDTAEPNPAWPAVRQAIHRAKHSGVKVDLTWKQLRNIFCGN